VTTKEVAPGLCLLTSHLRLVFFKPMSNLVISRAPIREAAPTLVLPTKKLCPVTTPFFLGTLAHELALRESTPLNSMLMEKKKKNLFERKVKEKRKTEDW
jgi:hypothetical protein